MWRCRWGLPLCHTYHQNPCQRLSNNILLAITPFCQPCASAASPFPPFLHPVRAKLGRDADSSAPDVNRFAPSAVFRGRDAALQEPIASLFCKPVACGAVSVAGGFCPPREFLIPWHRIFCLFIYLCLMASRRAIALSF